MQEAVVALIVLVAAAYSAWSLMPRGWRDALRRRFAPGSAPPAPGGCASCSDCGACDPTAPSARRDAVQPVRWHAVEHSRMAAPHHRQIDRS